MADLTPFEALSRMPLGRALSPLGREQLASIASIERLASGSIIFREGQFYSRVHWVYRGRVALTMAAAGGASKPLLTLGEGDLLAWSALLGNQRMTAGATAVTDTVLLGFDASALLDLCDSSPAVGYRVMRHVASGLSSRLLATRLQFLDLFSHPQEGAP